jgi:hypothetical protein
MGGWVNGYRYLVPILIPILPIGYNFIPIFIPMGSKIFHTHPLMVFLPVG